MQDVLGDATADDLAAAWRLAYAISGQQVTADAAVEAAVASQVSWLGPPSPVELLSATYREIETETSVPPVSDGDSLNDAWWALPADQRAALWLCRAADCSNQLAAEILGLAPGAVLALVNTAEDHLIPPVILDGCIPRADLERRARGDLTSAAAAADVHLASCPECADRLRRVGRVTALADPVTGPVPVATSAGLAALDRCLATGAGPWAGDDIHEEPRTPAPDTPDTEARTPAPSPYAGLPGPAPATAVPVTPPPTHAPAPPAPTVAMAPTAPPPPVTEPAPEAPIPVADPDPDPDPDPAPEPELAGGSLAQAALAAFYQALGESPPEPQPEPAAPDDGGATTDALPPSGPEPPGPTDIGPPGLPPEVPPELGGSDLEPEPARRPRRGLRDRFRRDKTVDTRPPAGEDGAAGMGPDDRPPGAGNRAEVGDDPDAEETLGRDEPPDDSVWADDDVWMPIPAGAGAGSDDDRRWTPDDSVWSELETPTVPQADASDGVAVVQDPAPELTTIPGRRPPVTVIDDETPPGEPRRRAWAHTLLRPRVLAGATVAVLAAGIVGVVAVRPPGLGRYETVRVGAGRSLFPRQPSTVTTPGNGNPLIVIPPGAQISWPVAGGSVAGAAGTGSSPGAAASSPLVTSGTAPPTSRGSSSGANTGTRTATGTTQPPTGTTTTPAPPGSTTTTTRPGPTTTSTSSTTAPPSSSTTTCIVLGLGCN